jgi:hypothetical protein
MTTWEVTLNNLARPARHLLGFAASVSSDSSTIATSESQLRGG